MTPVRPVHRHSALKPHAVPLSASTRHADAHIRRHLYESKHNAVVAMKTLRIVAGALYPSWTSRAPLNKLGASHRPVSACRGGWAFCRALHPRVAPAHQLGPGARFRETRTLVHAFMRARSSPQNASLKLWTSLQAPFEFVIVVTRLCRDGRACSCKHSKAAISFQVDSTSAARTDINQGKSALLTGTGSSKHVQASAHTVSLFHPPASEQMQRYEHRLGCIGNTVLIRLLDMSHTSEYGLHILQKCCAARWSCLCFSIAGINIELPVHVYHDGRQENFVYGMQYTVCPVCGCNVQLQNLYQS